MDRGFTGGSVCVKRRGRGDRGRGWKSEDRAEGGDERQREQTKELNISQLKRWKIRRGWDRNEKGDYGQWEHR